MRRRRLSASLLLVVLLFAAIAEAGRLPPIQKWMHQTEKAGMMLSKVDPPLPDTGRGVVLAVDYSGRLWAFAQTGKLLWNVHHGPLTATIASGPTRSILIPSLQTGHLLNMTEGEAPKVLRFPISEMTSKPGYAANVATDRLRFNRVTGTHCLMAEQCCVGQECFLIDRRKYTVPFYEEDGASWQVNYTIYESVLEAPPSELILRHVNDRFLRSYGNIIKKNPALANRLVATYFVDDDGSVYRFKEPVSFTGQAQVVVQQSTQGFFLYVRTDEGSFPLTTRKTDDAGNGSGGTDVAPYDPQSEVDFTCPHCRDAQVVQLNPNIVRELDPRTQTVPGLPAGASEGENGSSNENNNNNANNNANSNNNNVPVTSSEDDANPKGRWQLGAAGSIGALAGDATVILATLAVLGVAFAYTMTSRRKEGVQSRVTVGELAVPVGVPAVATMDAVAAAAAVADPISSTPSTSSTDLTSSSSTSSTASSTTTTSTPPNTTALLSPSSSSSTSSSATSVVPLSEVPVAVQDPTDTNAVLIGNLKFWRTRQLGRGSDATVFEGVFDSRPVAVKRMHSGSIDRARTEIEALVRLDNHPNVIRYFYQIATLDHHYLALELCAVSLHGIITSRTRAVDRDGLELRWAPAVDISPLVHHLQITHGESRQSRPLHRMLQDIFSALEHIHANLTVHRDVKPHNILLGWDGRVLLSDFGIARDLVVDATNLTRPELGTLGWLAPELHSPALHSNESNVQVPRAAITVAADAFALGCVVYFMYTSGQHPFGSDLGAMLTNMHTGTPQVDAHLTPLDGIARDLILKLIRRDPSLRPTMARALLHPLLWSDERKVEFLREASALVNDTAPEPNVLRIQQRLEEGSFGVVGRDWTTRLDEVVWRDMRDKRGYDVTHVRGLLRAVRNKAEHFKELRPEVKVIYGSYPTGYLQYFHSRFPDLFMHTYDALEPFIDHFPNERIQKFYRDRPPAA